MLRICQYFYKQTSFFFPGEDTHAKKKARLFTCSFIVGCFPKILPLFLYFPTRLSWKLDHEDKKNLGRVEILRNNELETVFFPKPEWSRYLNSDDKSDLEWNVERGNFSEKMTDFLERSEVCKIDDESLSVKSTYEVSCFSLSVFSLLIFFVFIFGLRFALPFSHPFFRIFTIE